MTIKQSTPVEPNGKLKTKPRINKKGVGRQGNTTLTRQTSHPPAKTLCSRLCLHRGPSPHSSTTLNPSEPDVSEQTIERSAGCASPQLGLKKGPPGRATHAGRGHECHDCTSLFWWLMRRWSRVEGIPLSLSFDRG